MVYTMLLEGVRKCRAMYYEDADKMCTVAHECVDLFELWHISYLLTVSI